MEKRDKKNFKSIINTIITLITLSKRGRKWFVIKCLNGAAMGIVWGVLTRYIEFFTKAAIDKDLQFFKEITLVYLVFIVFMILIRFTGPFLGNRYSMYAIRDLKQNILFNIHDLKINYFDDKHSGDIVTKLSNDVDIIENFIKFDLTTLFGYLPGSFGYSVTVLFIMNTKLTLFVLPLVIAASFFTIRFSFKMREISNQRQKYVSNMNMILRDILENISITKIYNLDKYFYNKYDSELLNAQHEENKVYKNNQVISVLGQLIRIVPFVIAYFLGIFYITKGQLTISQLIGYTALVGFTFGSFANLFAIFSHAAQSTGAMDHINEITKGTKERIDGDDFTKENCENVFEFKNVYFEYVKDIGVINNMSFKVKKGSKTALVGESGCGKSTVVKLLQGYYENFDGTIFINDRDLNSWELKSLRNNFSYVSQDEYLFADSIKTNILYGKINATSEEFENVCEITGVNEIASELENGYDSIIGERGSKLSGGQRQRINLARALISDNQFILLDEPTSNLDTKSEYYIEKAINSTKNDKTILIIAHRLSTIINCDSIIVVKDGVVVEEGTHVQLIRKKGEYYNLYNLQEVV